uniref:Uncharacterized protein n=1 Tax=Heliothis virescens TaxID=7102 RepID=A0A2A4J7J1_HELVI
MFCFEEWDRRLVQRKLELATDKLFGSSAPQPPLDSTLTHSGASSVRSGDRRTSTTRIHLPRELSKRSFQKTELTWIDQFDKSRQYTSESVSPSSNREAKS